MMESDHLLRLQSGEAGAFSELVEAFKNPVLNTCYRFVLNPQDAEEIAQEVFVEVYRGLASFRGEAKLSTWIYRIAVTRSLDFLRRKNRRKRMQKLRSLFDWTVEADEADGGIHPDPARSLEQAERLHILSEAISRLPEKQQTAFTLSKCQDFSSREIAELMGISVPAVDALVHRARNTLRKRLTAVYEKGSGADEKAKGKNRTRRRGK